MRIDPRHLAAVAEIYEAGGFTEAATRLSTSQPALSRLVRNLEERLGEPIFNRVRKPIELTLLGTRLVEEGRAVRVAMARASDSVNRIRSGEEGEIKIGGMPFVLDGVTSPLIAEYQATHPHVSVFYHYGFLDDLIEWLQVGAIDIAVCPLTPLKPELDLLVVPLVRGDNAVVARVGHPIFRTSPITLDDLLKYSWVAPPVGGPLYFDFKNTFATRGATKLNLVTSGCSLYSVISHLEKTDFLSMLPRIVVDIELDKNKIAPIPFNMEQAGRAFCMIFPKSYSRPSAVEDIISFMKAKFVEVSTLLYGAGETFPAEFDQH